MVWFAVKCRPHQQSRAIINLERQKFETLCPYQLTSVTRFGRRVEKSRPIFPGYVFVRSELNNCHLIGSTYGIAYVLKNTADRPQNIPMNVIEDLKSLCSPTGEWLPPKNLSAGDQVRFLSGPLQDQMAQVVAAPEHDRIFVFLDLFGQIVKTSALLNNLERVSWKVT